MSTVIRESSRTALECALRFISEHMFISFMDNTACLLIAFCRHSFRGRYGLIWRAVFLTQVNKFQCSTRLVNFRSLSYALLYVNSHLSKMLLPYRGTRRRCSAKYLFRSGNSAGWEINYCYRFQLGILHFFKHFEPSWLDFPKD